MNWEIISFSLNKFFIPQRFSLNNLLFQRGYFIIHLKSKCYLEIWEEAVQN